MWEVCTSWFWLFWSYTPPTPPAPSRINGEYTGSQLAKQNTFKMRMVRAGNAVSAAVGISVLLHLGGAHKCNVTQRDQQTTYNIPGLSYARGTSDSSCTFTWSNASQTVFATHVNKMEPVTMSRFGELVSSKCIGNMIFSGTCVTEGTPKDYTASCNVTCLPEAEETIGDKGMPPSQIGVIVAAFIAAAVLLLVGLVCFLCYKYRLRSKCCGQTGGFYPRVMFKKAPQAKADVETEGG